MKTLFLVLCAVESGCVPNPPDGDGGKAIGPYQIHYVYWKDSGVEGDYQDCRDKEYAEKVITAYMKRYKPAFVKNELTREEIITLARIHNGGPKGDTKKSTIKYGKRVSDELTRIMENSSRE